MPSCVQCTMTKRTLEKTGIVCQGQRNHVGSRGPFRLCEPVGREGVNGWISGNSGTTISALRSSRAHRSLLSPTLNLDASGEWPSQTKFAEGS